MLNIRLITEKQEEQLSPYATKSVDTKGRLFPIEPCDIRTEFQRDRDRIIHSKAFRRLKHKTQVFITPEGDHYRTRLTHTLEVSQIARTITRALRLNEDLVEAAALGHDLGHTPFGHAGEMVLNEICPFGFKHAEQSLRIVDHLEGGNGLNLTFEIRDAILNHTGDNLASTREGIILKYADKIAYINHDIDDAIRGGILEDIPHEFKMSLGKTHSQRINTMIMDIVKNSGAEIQMSKEIYEAMHQLRSFMFENVYIGSSAKTEDMKVKKVISELYAYFTQNPGEIPPLSNEQSTERLACDYIAGMSDRFALFTFNKLFLPSSWQR